VAEFIISSQMKGVEGSKIFEFFKNHSKLCPRAMKAAEEVAEKLDSSLRHTFNRC
jgi:hypothetical protein